MSLRALPASPAPPRDLLPVPRVDIGVSCFGNQSGLFATEDHSEFSLLTNARFPLTWQLSLGQNLLNLIETGRAWGDREWRGGREYTN